MPNRRYILASAISLPLILGLGASLLLGQGSLVNLVQAFPSLVNDGAVHDGAKVTVRYHITPQNDPATTYSDTEQFIQGQHIIPPALEQRMAGMHSGESKQFSLSAEEGFGPYDETKVQTIPTTVLPLEAREGDIIDDNAGRTGKIVRIFPEWAVLDFNHPLAGQPLIVKLQIVSIESPDDRGINI